MCEGLLLGPFLRGSWSWHLGHLVVWLGGLRFLESCADTGADLVEGWQGVGVWCRDAPGEEVNRQALGVLLYGDGGSGAVLRRPLLWVLVQRVEADSVMMFPAV